MKREIALLETKGDIGDVMQAKDKVLELYQDMSSKPEWSETKDEIKIIASAERKISSSRDFRLAGRSSEYVLCFDASVRSLYQQVKETLRLCRENNLENPWESRGEEQKPVFHITFVFHERHNTWMQWFVLPWLLLCEHIRHSQFDWHVQQNSFSSIKAVSTSYESANLSA